jgi:MFS family permease
VEPSRRVQRVTRIVRTAIGDLFDQSKPFGRLALVHALVSAGSTVVAVGLADSVFFSAVTPKAAESKVLLYLLVTMAPFALVAPLLAPLLDRGRQARRRAMPLTAAASALFCVAMARDYKSFLLYPEAFAILVLSKLYLVTKAALVPAMTTESDDLASANAKLAVLAGLAGFAVSPFAVALLQAGAFWVMCLGAVVFIGATVAAVRLPRIGDGRATAGAPGEGTSGQTPPASPRLADLGQPVAPSNGHVSRPGEGLVARRGGTDESVGTGEQRSPGDLGIGSPLGSTADRPIYGPLPPALAGPAGGAAEARPGDVKPLRQRVHLPGYSPEILLALAAMSVVRGSVGFVTFFLAFALKHDKAATWLYGVIILASGVGGLAGSMLVPWLRRTMSEQLIILNSLIAGGVFALGTALIGGLWAQPLLTFVIGLAGTTAKPAFDSLVQRHVPPQAQGRAFARFETRLQLVWVLAALVAVVVDFSFRGGDAVVAVACGIAAVFYGSMRQVGRHYDAETTDSGSTAAAP